MSQVPFTSLDKNTKDQYAVVFATLLLHDAGQEATEESINNIISKSGNSVAAYWPGLFLTALGGKNIGDFLVVSGGGSGAGPAQAGTTGGQAEAKVEEKKESEEEANVSMGGLFSD
jgi:ribosomal protein L12E/L44/L45/RPP1/RPP2